MSLKQELGFPTTSMELTTILVVSNMKKSKDFYLNILGADLVREYGGSSTVLKLMGQWILLVTAGQPTEDKPKIHFLPPQDPNSVSHSFTIRVEPRSKIKEIQFSDVGDWHTDSVGTTPYTEQSLREFLQANTGL